MNNPEPKQDQIWFDRETKKGIRVMLSTAEITEYQFTKSRRMSKAETWWFKQKFKYLSG